MNDVAWLLLVFGAGSIALRRADTRIISGRAAYLLRSLFPSWRFFDVVGRPPVLFVRSDADNVWRRAEVRYPRRPFALWFNPEVNGGFTRKAIAEHLAGELEQFAASPERIRATVSYALLMRVAAEAVRRTPVQEARRLQFRLDLCRPGQAPCVGDTAFVSAWEDLDAG